MTEKHIASILKPMLQRLKYSDRVPEQTRTNHKTRIGELLECSRIPTRHLKSICNDFNPSGKWMEYCDVLKDGFKTSGVLYCLLGPRGTGKTQLACEAMRSIIISNAIMTRYYKAMEFFLMLKNAYRNDSQFSEENIIRKFCEFPILVLDEIHVRSESEWENNLLTHIIDKRYDDMLSTVLISNITYEHLPKAVGASIYSRLVETGGVMQCDWEPFRGKE